MCGDKKSWRICCCISQQVTSPALAEGKEGSKLAVRVVTDTQAFLRLEHLFDVSKAIFICKILSKNLQNKIFGDYLTS